ncbi:MAG TPA: type II toxin-antitoxin system RelB/DinJ family antitoxin [Candidatus Rifleibacterium sp.]|nr:type II toxin-antitoxin system RelB/DinJ family antitoxin [Candidatus Rifleibacterium sp.]
MRKTATIQTRVEPGIKIQVEKVLKTLGITTSEAIGIFFRRIIMEQGLPFPVKITNPETIKAIDEAIEGKNLSKVYNTPEEMFEDLDA